MFKPKKLTVDRRNFLKSAAAGAGALATAPGTVAAQQQAELLRTVPPPMSPEAETGTPRVGPPQLSLESFISYVRHSTNQMPPNTSKAISDQDLTDTFAYLKSIPLPTKGKDIPLLNK